MSKPSLPPGTFSANVPPTTGKMLLMMTATKGGSTYTALLTSLEEAQAWEQEMLRQGRRVEARRI